ncbi:5-methylcytosine-specific restriction endonuclease system specificity protein McrC [Boudabousia tangfeifanii]|uniref:5-methylcytosine-specific restriction endonuclease system specificity protein McrC n=1 Tax=Boudabousia tangfeifanii TaxID=1912795 RepID=A0A1D9MIM7_9ACTO|nr:5-methylcytosine-specific restriction endonuclease system specificity protein McrC [Boudabousia tangfeifanii]AOZ72144.1 5-methylcytosine-specific restriction endonuclease system specificity protein McrC [Boudabousia tangfeifanii]
MIPTRNIYYMLAYAFTVLREDKYREVATEDFDHSADLLAAILERGISSQVKRGLGRDYLDRTDQLSSLRGKIEVSESVKTQAFQRRQMVCSYDDFSVDTAANRIIKATVNLLLRSDIDKSRKKSLRKLMVFFAEVRLVDLRQVSWRLRYDRNNQTYRMLIGVCWLVFKGLLQTEDDGSTRLMSFFDESSMCRLYEKFILEFYRQEHPELTAEASQIGWVLDDGFSDMLPIMRSDITLSRGEEVLIIDAKYYSHTTTVNYDVHKIKSANLYQIFTYVKNKDASLNSQPHQVSGMLLYAKTDEEIQPDCVYQMSGNQISVKTLDLNLPFEEIRAQLDQIVSDHFA